MSQLLNAIVKYPALKAFETQYGTRVNAVLTVGDEEIKIWADAESRKAEQLKALRKGEQVLILNDNGKYKLLEDTPNTTTNGNGNGKTKAEYEPLSDEKKRMMMGYIQEMAGFYGYCREQAIATLTTRFDENEITDDDIRSMTATLFIATQKRFGI